MEVSSWGKCFVDGVAVTLPSFLLPWVNWQPSLVWKKTRSTIALRFTWATTPRLFKDIVSEAVVVDPSSAPEVLECSVEAAEICLLTMGLLCLNPDALDKKFVTGKCPQACVTLNESASAEHGHLEAMATAEAEAVVEAWGRSFCTKPVCDEGWSKWCACVCV